MKNLLLLFSLIGLKSVSQTLPFSKMLDKNQVHARINTTNDKFWNYYGNWGPSYEVPAGSGKHAMFANSIWIGGTDVGGQLHIAANTYKQSGTDFWPGPLDTLNAAPLSSTGMAPYNKVWKIDCDSINAFVNAFNTGQIASGAFTVPNDILTYPGNGSGNFQHQMAPYMDINGDGIYDPLGGGDYPIIHGQQQILSIYNDNFGSHTETMGSSMGLEIHEHSFAFSDPNVHDSMQAINYSTFYLYTIYNRSNTRYNNVFITDWSDVDVGYFANDLLGTDTINEFAYIYNDGANDPTSGTYVGYGNKPPVSSLMLLPTNCSSDGIDNDNDGVIDESGERFMMDKTTFYNNNYGAFPPQTTNPSIAIQYYNYMSGFWKDGTSFTQGGNAYGGTASSDYVYPGDPQNATGWTEGTAGNTSGDRRVLLSSGPFSLPAHSKMEWVYAVVFSQDTANVNTITEFHERVQKDVKNVRYYYQQHQTPLCTPAVNPPVATAIKHSEQTLSGTVFPSPTSGYLKIELNQNIDNASVMVIDMLGRKMISANFQSSYRTELDISSLPQGVYFLTVSSEKGSVCRKIVKR